MSTRNFSDPRYLAWRKKVYARDKYRCRMPGCPGTDKRLNAHHVKTWAGNPTLRYVPANGITLCRTHHELVRGREEEFEATFSGLVNQEKTDFALLLMMKKYEGKRPDEKS